MGLPKTGIIFHCVSLEMYLRCVITLYWMELDFFEKAAVMY